MRGVVFVWGADWAEEGEGVTEVRARGILVLVVLGGLDSGGWEWLSWMRFCSTQCARLTSWASVEVGLRSRSLDVIEAGSLLRNSVTAGREFLSRPSSIFS